MRQIILYEVIADYGYGDDGLIERNLTKEEAIKLFAERIGIKPEDVDFERAQETDGYAIYKIQYSGQYDSEEHDFLSS